jgi:hypothetical protein
MRSSSPPSRVMWVIWRSSSGSPRRSGTGGSAFRPTLCWRKRDSNPRSHLKEQPAELHLFDLRCSPEHCPGAARRSWGHAPDEVGPRVRIPFAPAVESRANLTSSIRAVKFAKRDGVTRRYAAWFGAESVPAGSLAND